MEAMRQSWTDDRLDDLSRRMDGEEMCDDKRQLIGEMQALQRTIIQIGWTGAITLIAAVVGVLIAQIF